MRFLSTTSAAAASISKYFPKKKIYMKSSSTVKLWCGASKREREREVVRRRMKINYGINGSEKSKTKRRNKKCL
jgi:hypothetical protein